MSDACVLDASAALSLLVAGQSTRAAKAFFLEPAHHGCPVEAPAFRPGRKRGTTELFFRTV